MRYMKEANTPGKPEKTILNAVFIDGYHQFHFEVLSALKKKVKIKYGIIGTRENWHGDKQLISTILESHFGDVRMDTIETFLFPDKICGLVNPRQPFYLNSKVLKKYARLENIYLRMTDRNAGFHLSIHQRRKFFHILLNYFLAIIENSQIDVAYCFDTPHSAHSNLFYNLLREHGIPVFVLEYHYLEDTSLVFEADNLPQIPSDFLEGLSAAEILNRLPKKFRDSLNTGSKFAANYISKEKKAAIKRSVFTPLNIVWRGVKKMATNLIQGFFPFLFKKEILHFTSLNGIKNRLIYRFKINFRLFALLKLQLKYYHISEIPDLAEGQKYIFLGLHMQPEKTTLPMAGEYDHQLTIIRTLVASLPAGWKLYVKEHPNQFNPRKIINANFRDSYFYRIVSEFPEVVWVDLSVPSRDLIQKAQMVATATGTLGWEAMLSGKTVLFFGEPYYSGCRAAFRIQSVNACKQAIEKGKATSAQEVKKELYRYLAYYQKEGLLVSAANFEEKIKMSSVDRDVHIKTLAARFLELSTQAENILH